MRYVIGDATLPRSDGPKMIVHVCNTAGGWGAGFVLSLSRRWRDPERVYRHNKSSGLELGTVQFVSVESDIVVANMIAQTGYGSTKLKHKTDEGYEEDHLPPIRYWALERCLEQVAHACLGGGFSVHMPRIGCSLAGGSWSKVSEIINRTLEKSGIDVTVYDLPGSTFNP